MFTAVHDDVLDVALGRQPLSASNETARLVAHLDLNRKGTAKPARQQAARAPAPAPKPKQPAAPPRRTAAPTSTATNAAKPPLIKRIPAQPPPRTAQSTAPARPAPAPQPELSRDDSLKAAWDSNPTLRAEFSGNYEWFTGYLDSKAAGRVQLPQPKKHGYTDRDGAR